MGSGESGEESLCQQSWCRLLGLFFRCFPLLWFMYLPDRLKVGQRFLVPLIGVRVPVRQQNERGEQCEVLPRTRNSACALFRGTRTGGGIS